MASSLLLLGEGQKVMIKYDSDTRTETHACTYTTGKWSEHKRKFVTLIVVWTLTPTHSTHTPGKCQLAIAGVGDPTGCGAGYSFVRAPNKPVALRHDNPIPRKKVTDDPNADLRCVGVGGLVWYCRV